MFGNFTYYGMCWFITCKVLQIIHDIKYKGFKIEQIPDFYKQKLQGNCGSNISEDLKKERGKDRNFKSEVLYF